MSERVVLVTGGTRNIGLAIAEALGQEGYSLILTYVRHKRAAEEARARLKDVASSVVTVQSDVTSAGAVDHLFKLIADQFGRLDVLVNNVGPFIAKPIAEMSVDEWHWILDGNLSSAFYCCRAALPLMRQQGSGHIINIGSLNVELARGAPNAAAYNAAKAGLVVLTRSLARSEGPYGIRVNMVNPGFIETENTTDADRESLPPVIPLRRLGKPEDVAAAVTFLISDKAAYITGAVINVAGGLWV